MNLPFFSLSFCNKLLDDIPDRLELYQSGEASIELESEGVFESKIKLTTPPSLDDATPKGDSQNAIELHQWLSIPQNIAADERVWTCLCHTLYYSYCHKRQSQKNAEIIRERFFMPGTGFTPRVSNRLSRLWWGAHLTYDPKRNDPYELTRTLFSFQEIQQSFMERAYGSCKPFLHVALEVLGKKSDELNNIPKLDALIKDLAREINIYGGTTLLEAIPPNRLKSVIEQRLNDLRSKNI